MAPFPGIGGNPNFEKVVRLFNRFFFYRVHPDREPLFRIGKHNESSALVLIFFSP